MRSAGPNNLTAIRPKPSSSTIYARRTIGSRGVILPSTPVLGLGPLGADPDHQRRGVGIALMHAVIGAADAMGEPLIALLGSPHYYPRFGFVRSTEHGIEPPNPHYGADFQVRTLAAHDPSVRGTFRYAAAFDATEGVT